jgi:hypothetical protein
MLELFKKMVAGGSSEREAPPKRRQARLALEALEDRVVPSTTTTPTPTTPTSTNTKPAILAPGSTLLPGQSLTAQNGNFRLTLQGDGNMVEYNKGGHAFFSTNTAGKTVTDAIMQGDGNFVMYDGTKAVWASNTSGNPGDFLELTNGGKLIITNGNTPVWARGPSTFMLHPGQQVNSANGQNHLVLQGDGNLVEYNASGKALWASGTNGTGVNQAAMQQDGNFVLYTPNSAVWATNTNGNNGAWLNVQNNGTISIYSGTHAIWTAHPTQG